MDFKWTKNVWKALKAGALSAGVIALSVGADKLLEPIDSAEELLALGVPVFVVPLAVAGLVSLKNYLKVKKGVAKF